MAAPTLDLKIFQGKTLQIPLIYHQDVLVYKLIEAVSSLAPARLTVTGHGIPTLWPIRIEGAKAPLELNTSRGSYKQGRRVDADTIEINDMNLIAAKPFIGPAVLVYPAPADMTGWKIRSQIRDAIGGTVLLDASSDVADGADGTITIDVANSTLTITWSDEVTAAITWLKAVWDVEALLPDGTVLPLVAPSKVTVEREVTVWA